MAKTPRQILDAQISETAFLQQIIDLALRTGWKVHHVFEQRQYARRTTKGFPDLVLVHSERKKLLFVEVKRQSGKLTKEQEDWLSWLKDVAQEEVYLWQPTDWNNICEILGEGRLS